MEPVNTLSAAVSNIVGVWLSPVSKNSYYFYPMKTGYAKMIIQQYNPSVLITCAYKIIQEEKILYLDIDDIVFEIIEIKLGTEPVLIIKSQNNKIIRLCKKWN